MVRLISNTKIEKKRENPMMWLKVLRQNINHLTRRARGSASIEHKNGNGSVKGNKTNNNGAEVNRNEDHNGSIDIKSQAKKKSGGPGSGPLLQQAEISSSQLDFFKMLDEKIENGPDYDESIDASASADRITGLLRRWELASISCSSLTEMRSVSTIKNHASILYTPRQSLSAKDREGMRNIIGGRPESAPVYMTANRIDGLQETLTASPNMPRHVLESISQSPTQSLKSMTPPGMSPINQRYQDYRDSNYQKIPKITKAAASAAAQYSHVQNSLNGDFLTQQQNLYREQYLQQTGMVTIPSHYSVVGSPAGKNNPYVQQFQITNSKHFPAPRKRDFNAAQMT
ncbi:uncharacterized protein LOC122507046 isoform X1 [Leptopilina heterotoma]|uniref:uncharacterized protein LOC122507046 isoform X1 n=1 Tax=Leptopilina heterotoma TaxID=63436 RepID=UPI001CA9492C|nr:uncharacterized protein LOC122507046 isoform X1 [Leptopilina heterotoma]